MQKSTPKKANAEAKKEKKVLIFCANEQAETEHVLDIDGNGEIILTCACGRFIKLPEGTDAKGIKKYIEKHNESNLGQRTMESIEESKEAILKDLDL